MSDDLGEEVELEMAGIERLLKDLSPLLHEVQATAPDIVKKLALAGLLHSFYTGIEAVLDRISLKIDGGRIRTETWHRDLLERMATTTESRSSVISEELRDILRGYLSFRHVFRNAYPSELQWLRPRVRIQLGAACSRE